MQDEAKLRLKFVEGVLFHEWDPIGVNEEFMANDEYDSYAPQIVTMSQQEDFNEDKVTKYLLEIETEKMGMPGNEENARKVARKLVDSLG